MECICIMKSGLTANQKILKISLPMATSCRLSALCQGKCKKVFYFFYVLLKPTARSLARGLHFFLYLCPDADESSKRNTEMRAKKQSADKMAIKFVEFDQNDKPISENVTPLGLYLHEYDTSRFY